MDGSVEHRLNYDDRIVSIGGSVMTNFASFTTALRQTRPGDTVGFVVFRSGQEITIPVALGEGGPVYRLEEVPSPTERPFAVRRVRLLMSR